MAFISFWLGGVVYLSAIYGVLVLIVISLASVHAPDDPSAARIIILSSDEERVFEKYYMFFRYPSGTQSFAHFVNYARIFGLIWIAIALWQKLYSIAAANAAFYLISVPLMWKLSPIAHYKSAAEKGVATATRELSAIQHIVDSRDELGF